jgi:hypothetical protein
MRGDEGDLSEKSPRLSVFLLRSRLPPREDLERLASYLQKDYLRQINDPDKVLGILAETRAMLLSMAKALEGYDSVLGGMENDHPKTQKP